MSGNVIVNTVAGVPAATFQPINKRLASPVIPGTLTVSRLHTNCISGFILVAHCIGGSVSCITDQKFHSLLTSRVPCDSVSTPLP